MTRSSVHTFLFTDIEASTTLWERHPDVMEVALARHDTLVRAAIVEAHGEVFKALGDAFCAAFESPSDAVAAAVAAQQALSQEAWPDGTPIAVRMAVHAGAAERRGGDYFGPTLNRVARLMATGHGGQTLVSQAVREALDDALPPGCGLRDLGAHRLKDLSAPEHVYQLQGPHLRADFPPIRSLSTHPSNLNRQSTTFIGRDRELATLERLFAKPRLLTLTGTGGSGKTRLANQLAANLLERFPDGAWLIELAPVLDAHLVLQAVATELAVRESLDQPLTQALVEFLKTKRLLLVLDNCEHVLDECARLAGLLLRQCPHVKILATSREALNVDGEQRFPVPSLSMPDRSVAQTPESLSQSDSARLFVDRALLARPTFQVTPKNAPVIGSICRRLDGIPLALELAAARTRLLSAAEIESRLEHRFRLLTGGSRDALPRQQTLRACIDWSYELLKVDERRLLERLSIFAGGWTLDAAEGVCALGEPDAVEVLDRLMSLVDKSLVLVEQQSAGSRFELLETVRQYAREKLDEGPDGAIVRRRHRDHFLALTEAGAAAHLNGDRVQPWTERLREESDNLRVALAESLADPSGAEGALRLCGGLYSYWWRWGRAGEGRDWCLAALAQSPEARTRPKLQALLSAGTMHYTIGDLRSARLAHAEALVLSRELGEESLEGLVHRYLGNVELSLGHSADAQRHYQASIDIHHRLGERALEATSLNSLASLFINENDLDAAQAPLEEAVRLSRDLGNREQTAYAVSRLGSIAQYRDAFEDAHAHHHEALAIARELGVRELESEQIRHLAEVAVRRDDFATARRLLTEALGLSRDQQSWFAMRECLDAMAELATKTHDYLDATMFWASVEAMREAMQAPRFAIDQARCDESHRLCRAALGDRAYDTAIETGRALSGLDAVEAGLVWLRSAR